MTEFTRIGGEIISAPLNDNFNKIKAEISRNVSGLVFNAEQGIQEHKQDMEALQNPVDGQVCYVVASGELYRYSTKDSHWYKIVDFGGTFKQVFLNSGVVALGKDDGEEEKPLIKKDTDNNIIIPSMIVYFKSMEGDSKYSRGVYKVPSKTILNDELGITELGYYSIYLLEPQLNIDDSIDFQYEISKGRPTQDYSNKIYLGGFMADTTEIYDKFIYTIPNIAYTQDRGLFIATDGQIKNGGLRANTEADNDTVLAEEGYYYYEGVNTPSGNLDDYPLDSNNSSNYNLRFIGGRLDPDELDLIYCTPNGMFSHVMTQLQGIIDPTKYYNMQTSQITNVPSNKFTILRHFITPANEDCTDLLIYGNKVYDTMEDALFHINDLAKLEMDFPAIELMRIIVKNDSNFTTSDPDMCSFNILDKYSKAANFDAYMEKDVYASNTNGVVKQALTSNTLQNSYTVDDDVISTNTLWTSMNTLEKIPQLLSGETEPDNTIGKNGDVYILLDE